MAHWDNENFNTQEPPNDVMCTTCKFRMKPMTVRNKEIDRSKYSQCDKYTMKPPSILWGEEPCPMYEQEVDHEF